VKVVLNSELFIDGIVAVVGNICFAYRVVTEKHPKLIIGKCL